MNFNTDLKQYLDFGRKLTAFYYEERYPPGPISSYTKKEIKEMQKIAEEIINRLKEEIEDQFS